MSDATPPAADAAVTVSAPHSLERRQVSPEEVPAYLALGWFVVHSAYADSGPAAAT